MTLIVNCLINFYFFFADDMIMQSNKIILLLIDCLLQQLGLKALVIKIFTSVFMSLYVRLLILYTIELILLSLK